MSIFFSISSSASFISNRALEGSEISPSLPMHYFLLLKFFAQNPCALFTECQKPSRLCLKSKAHRLHAPCFPRFILLIRLTETLLMVSIFFSLRTSFSTDLSVLKKLKAYLRSCQTSTMMLFLITIKPLFLQKALR